MFQNIASRPPDRVFCLPRNGVHDIGDRSLLFAALPGQIAPRIAPPTRLAYAIALSRCVLVAGCLSGWVPTATAQAGAPERGQAFAEAHCASCHAIGPTGASRLAAAPPFRDLHKRYPVEQLAEALAEGITTGHAAMPEFQLDPLQIDELLGYLRTLEH